MLEGWFLVRPLFLASLPFSFLPLSCPLFLQRPSGPHQGSLCSSHMWAVSAYPTKINPATQCEDLCVCPRLPPHPLSFSLSLSLSPSFLSLTYLCPIDENWLHSRCFPPPWSGLLRALTAQFYALLLQLLHGEQPRQSICEDTEGNELALCLNTLTYRRDHVVGQAFNKRKGQNV